MKKRAYLSYMHECGSVTLIRKSDIMKFAESVFRDRGYMLAKNEFGATDLDGPAAK